LVAPESTVGSSGLRYLSVLRALRKTVLTPYELAFTMVDSYSKNSSKESAYVLSAIDLSRVGALADTVNAVAHVLVSHIHENNRQIKKLIKKCGHKNHCTTFYDGVYVDLLHFYRNLLNIIDELKLSDSIYDEFKTTLLTGIDLCSEIIITKVASRHHAKTGWLSIYFPTHALDMSYYGLQWTLDNPQWLQLLELL